MSMRYPQGISRSRSTRRTQRSSQRSADSKLTSHTPDSGVVSQMSDNQENKESKEVQEQVRNGSKKSTSLMVDVPTLSPPIVTLDTPDNTGNGTAPSVVSNGAEKERISARERWSRGKAIIRGEIESQKSGGSQGSGGQNNISR